MFVIHQADYRLRFYPSNLSEQLWIHPALRSDALAFFRDYLRPGDKVIDVGANIGDTTLTSAIRVAKDGYVWAIEPHPRTYKFLLANLKLNHIQNVQVINSAAGESNGEVNFTNDRRDDMNRIGKGRLVVRIQPLDDLIPYRGTVALLKIDVEGFEKQVLSGAAHLLDVTRCVYFEISKLHFSWFGYKISDLLRMLHSRGFQLFRIPSNGRLQHIDYLYESDEVENLIAAKDISELVQRTGWDVL